MVAYQSNRMQLGVAWQSLRALIADPEDTPRVFEIIRAMSGPSLRRGLTRFRGTRAGRRVLVGRIDLLDTLRDRPGLLALPAGSLGRAYADFVYGESLSADGLVDASMDEGGTVEYGNADMKRYAERLRDQHDLWHTVTQYGRDVLGEACLLAFTYAQTRNRGVGLIVAVGGWRLGRALGFGAVAAMWRAYRAGCHASWLPGEDWEDLLRLPVDEVRRLLAIRPPAAPYAELRAAAAPAAG